MAARCSRHGASFAMIAGQHPPSSMTAFRTHLPHEARTSFPTSRLPVKAMRRGTGCSTRRRPAPRPVPVTTLKTPGGQSRFDGEPGHPHGAERRALIRFGHDGATDGKSGSQLGPKGAQRIIVGGDGPHHAHGLTHDEDPFAVMAQKRKFSPDAKPPPPQSNPPGRPCSAPRPAPPEGSCRFPGRPGPPGVLRPRAGGGQRHGGVRHDGTPGSHAIRIGYGGHSSGLRPPAALRLPSSGQRSPPWKGRPAGRPRLP